MSDVDTTFLAGLLQNIQRDLDILKDGQREIRQELIAIRGHVSAIQADVTNLYAGQAKIELRLERVERGLAIAAEPAE
ncbi:MAG: hypothetical protein AAGM04_08040 [Pseudomonadota bacterium]